MNRRDVIILAAATVSIGRSSLSAANKTESNSNRAGKTSLDRFVAAYMAEMNTPGLTLGVATRGEAAHAECYGYADTTARTAISPSQLFEIGSITKSFTAIVILQLQDEGKLNVQDSILRHLPWLPMEADFGEVKIHHLLTHTSGFPSNFPVRSAPGVPRPRQSFKPGTQFHYSNWGYVVLGELISAVSGMSLGAALRKRILQPLEMNATAPVIAGSALSRIVPSYV